MNFYITAMAYNMWDKQKVRELVRANSRREALYTILDKYILLGYSICELNIKELT